MALELFFVSVRTNKRHHHQALDRMEYTMTNAIAPPDVGIIGPHFNISSHIHRAYSL